MYSDTVAAWGASKFVHTVRLNIAPFKLVQVESSGVFWFPMNI